MSNGTNSSGTGGKGGGAVVSIEDFPEAFASGTDFEATGDVNHPAHWASWNAKTQWEQFADEQGQKGVTKKDINNLKKDWQGFDENGNDLLFGYVRTSNSFKINEQLYDPKNKGKSMEEIFTRKDKHGKLHDLDTVNSLDKLISKNKTQKDASFTRFTDDGSIQASLGLTDKQMARIASAGSMTPKQLAQLNKSLAGTEAFSAAYTSTSANRSLNAFQGKKYERKLNIPKGTNAYVVKNNAQESEVIFGRNMRTKLTGISIANDGHIVLHETFVGYE